MFSYFLKVSPGPCEPGVRLRRRMTGCGQIVSGRKFHTANRGTKSFVVPFERLNHALGNAAKIERHRFGIFGLNMVCRFFDDFVMRSDARTELYAFAFIGDRDIHSCFATTEGGPLDLFFRCHAIFFSLERRVSPPPRWLRRRMTGGGQSFIAAISGGHFRQAAFESIRPEPAFAESDNNLRMRQVAGEFRAVVANVANDAEHLN